MHALVTSHNVKGLKVWTLAIVPLTSVKTQAEEQQHFTISEVAADWHELIPQHTMWPSIVCTN